MHSDIVYKLSLVTSAGLNLAQIPKSQDRIKDQLSGGILSAMLSFSKEIHDRDIESISYHDRNIVFIPINDIFIVAELSAALDQSMLDNFMEKFKKNATPLFNGFTSDQLNTDNASQKLTTIYESDWLHQTIEDLGFEQSLQNANITLFQIDESGNIMDTNSTSQKLLEPIANMVHNGNKSGRIRDKFTCGFVMLNKIQKASFVISQNSKQSTNIGLITVGEENAEILFRMTPVLMDSAMSQIDREETVYLDKLMEELRSTHDIDPSEYLKRASHDKSFTYLDECINQIGKALFAIVTGNQICVVSEDKSKVESIINLLLVFNQHLITDVYSWFEPGTELARDITGISMKNYNSLKENDKLPEEITVFDLDNNKIEGTNLHKNNFLKNLYERTKSLSINQASDVIFKELELIISYAINATSNAVLAKEDALNQLTNLKRSISDNDQFEIIQTLASKLNHWLHSMVYDKSFDQGWI